MTAVVSTIDRSINLDDHLSTSSGDVICDCCGSAENALTIPNTAQIGKMTKNENLVMAASAKNSDVHNKSTQVNRFDIRQKKYVPAKNHSVNGMSVWTIDE